MKKNFIISIIFTSMILLGNAQKLTQMTQAIAELRITSLPKSYIFEDSKDVISFMSIPIWWSDDAGNNSYIMQIDRNANEIQSIQPNFISLTYSVLQVCNNKSEFIAYLSDYKKGDSQYTIWKNTYNKTEKASFEPEKVASFELNSKDEYFMFTSRSEDQSKYSILFFVYDSKKVLKKIHALAIDNEGNLLWHKNENINFPSKTFYIKGCEISNNGTIYSTIVSHDINSRGNIVSNEYLNILTLTENEAKVTSEAVKGFTIRHTAMKILKNGNIAISGYSSAEIKSVTDNVFQIQFDPHNETFSPFKKYPFNKIDDLVNRKTSGGQIKTEKFKFDVVDIVELENGDLITLGEMREIIRKVYSSGMPICIHHAANILYHNFSERNTTNIVINKYQKGTSSWSSKSYTSSWNEMRLSYSHFVKGNDIYFVYNDDAKNIDKPRTDGGVYTCTSDKNAGVILAKIDANGNVSKNIIHRAKTNSYHFYTNLHPFEDEILLFFNKENGMFTPNDNMIFKLTDF